MTDFVDHTLLSVLKTVVDNRGRSCPIVDEGFPLIATNCVKDATRYPVFENVRFVSEEVYRDWFRGHPEPGDIIFVCKGSPGRVAMVPAQVNFCIAQDMVSLRPDREIIDARYLYYRLNARDVRHTIEGMHVGTMIPHFKKGDFGKLRFRIHQSLEEQAAVANVLSSLDDKIDANTQLLKDLDELLRLRLRLLMLINPEEKPLSSCAEFVNGQAFTKDASGTGRVVIRIAELNSGLGLSTVYSDAVVSERHVAFPGDILFAWSGSLTLARWFREPGIINQHIFKVIPKDGYPPWLVFGLIEAKLDHYKDIAANKATTMGHIQRHHLDELVRMPSREQITDEDKFMSDLWQRALAAELESLRLIELRDELIPALMSGKLGVGHADELGLYQ